MDAAYVLGWIVGYAVAVGIGLLLTFWVVRAAILSALSEDRRRIGDVKRYVSEPAAPNRHWLSEPTKPPSHLDQDGL